jgi:DNA-binding beta-propeller fold protein YncE
MRIFLILSVVLFATACKKSSTDAVNDVFDPNTATLVASGSFQSNAHPVSGTAKIYTSPSGNKLYLQNFSTDNGPDLKVYLSKDISANDFLDLGKIKSTNGNQLYDLPAIPNLNTYKYVLIWCKQFSVLFGNATMN